MQNFRVTNKEYYGMLWYFLWWSIRTPHEKGNYGLCATSINLLCEFPNPDITKDKMLSYGASFSSVPTSSAIFVHEPEKSSTEAMLIMLPIALL